MSSNTPLRPGDEPECPGCGGTLLVARSSSPVHPWRCYAGWCATVRFTEDGRQEVSRNE